MFFIYAGLIVVIVLVGGWLGLRVWPKPFPVYPSQHSPWQTMPYPKKLPTPVGRYFRRLFSDHVPVLHSSVITGRAKLRIMGIPMTGRWRFIHEAGKNYRHYIEVTLFGYPIMRVNERYLDNIGRMELPVVTIEDDPKVNQAANLGLWGESIWLPSIFLTDPRVRWEGIDAHTARLYVPFEDTQEDCFTVHFDHETGLIDHMEAMRWHDAKDTEKTRWLLNIKSWATYSGICVPSLATVTWEPDGKPWLVCHVEDIVFNADVRDYVRQRGI